MTDYSIGKKGMRNRIFTVYIPKRALVGDAESQLGVVLDDPSTGLTNASISKMGYIREGAAADVIAAEVAGTLGTYKDWSFILMDDTNAPGMYQVCFHNDAFKPGVNSVTLFIVFADTIAARNVQIKCELLRSVAV